MPGKGWVKTQKKPKTKGKKYFFLRKKNIKKTFFRGRGGHFRPI